MDTEDDILAEILEYGDIPPRQPGDIDASQIATGDRHKRSVRWAHNKMDKIALNNDNYISLRVYDPKKKRPVRVLRKIMV